MPRKTSLVEHEVNMTPAQIRKVMKGATTLLKADQVVGKGTRIHISPSKHKKLARAGAKKKGFKLAMTPDELEMSTTSGGMVCPSRSRVKVPHPKPVTQGLPKNLALSGLDGKPDEKGGKINFKRIGRQIKNTVNDGLRSYRENVRPVVAPVLKEGVKQAIKQGLPAAVAAAATATGQPQLLAALPAVKMVADKIADPATQYLGRATGAYGVTRGGALLQSNYSNFLNARHPAQNPALPPHDNSLPFMKGGSFRAVGSRTYGGSILGSPMSPLLPQGDHSQVRLRGKGFRSI